MQVFLPQIFKNLKYFTWNFSEPGHGKGAMDGVGGSLKRNADTQVLHGADITSALDFVNLFKESKTNVLGVSCESFRTMKSFIPEEIEPVKGIMSVRQISWGARGGAEGRRLTCLLCIPGTKCKHFHMCFINFSGSDSTGPSKPKAKVT